MQGSGFRVQGVGFRVGVLGADEVRGVAVVDAAEPLPRVLVEG